MNFLQLCQRLRQETGIADSGPAAVTGQTGDMKRLVDWVNESWIRLQSSRQDWAWLWANTSVTLTTGSHLVDIPTAVDKLVEITRDGAPLKQMDYADFRESYRTIGSGVPSVFAIRPDNKLIFNAEPTSDVTFAIEYYAKPSYFASGTASPALPERFHMLIVWQALLEYAMFDEAPELSQKAQVNAAQLYAELARDQSPELSLPGALA